MRFCVFGEENPGFTGANPLARGAAEVVQNVMDKRNLGVLTSAKKNEIVCKKQMGEGGPVLPILKGVHLLLATSVEMA